jgi:2-iminobutanoate/2-iminopropanoate deaminase
MSRSYLTALVALTLLALPGRVSAQEPLKELVVPAGGNVGQNFSPGIRTGNLLFVTGQVGPGDDVAAQTRATLDRVKAIVEAGGATMANVVKCTVFLTDIADYAAMNEAYRPYFPDPKPARSTFQIVSLAGATSKVEIECIAVVPER